MEEPVAERPKELSAHSNGMNQHAESQTRSRKGGANSPPWKKFLPDFNYRETTIHPVSDDLLFENRVLCARQPEAIKQSYKRLRTQVLKKMVVNGWNSLAVMAMRQGEGATLTAVNLAISLALDPRVSVLLVDLNLRQPGVHKYFGYSPSVGLQDYCMGLVNFSQLLMNPGIDRLVVLANEDRMEQSSEFLTASRVAGLIEDIKGRYANRVILFDFPPLLEADDALACMHYFDAGLLVINDGRTGSNDLKSASLLLGDKPILGSVLTDTSE